MPANVKNLKPTRVLVTAVIDRSNSGPKVSGLGGAIMGKNRRKLGVESKPKYIVDREKLISGVKKVVATIVLAAFLWGETRKGVLKRSDFSLSGVRYT